MRPGLLLLHGWGFDLSLWDALAERLTHHRIVRWDRGYFGPPAEPPVEPPFVAVGHSLGAMLLADILPPETPLIAINGFDHFTGEGAVPARVVERMRLRFIDAPDTVVTEFRARCGAPPARSASVAPRLADDLALLATHQADASDRPCLSLHGHADPILPETLRDTAFPGAIRATHSDAGHLLPVTHPDWCAAQIESFLC
jgi:pimeloyl-[acyl-carrier protein] methyl ester esterase